MVERLSRVLRPDGRQVTVEKRPANGSAHTVCLMRSGQPACGRGADKNDVSSTIRISDGSVLKAYVTAVKYVGFGGGVTLRINSYQILRLEQHASPFKREQGYRSSYEATEA